MFPRTRWLVPALVLLLTGACGTPPEPLPTGPPRPHASISLPSGGLVPPAAPTTATYTLPPPTQTFTVPPVPTTLPTTTPTTAPTPSPSPTPSHAARCTGQPTGAQIIELARKEAGVPDGSLTVTDGPYCSGTWSFTTLGMTGAEPLSVVATGAGATLQFVTAGTDVCNPQVKAQAPAGIRVLACAY
ncbi:hypothetical protein [Actinoplanes utahensis]|uniref:hypothetical protein n=1 Tax=Actinoplanes utahensis TaxID=1869 RepID=UPI00068A9D68|nr:hypothetical protein [Actinoplanes utahensis]GIF31070.1 hypothetical protein Aut01nite_40560 [Actinoplanes utahensis]